MTTAAEKSALQTAARATLDLANALTVGPTQEELDTANATIRVLQLSLATANATIHALETKINSALDILNAP